MLGTSPPINSTHTAVTREVNSVNYIALRFYSIMHFLEKIIYLQYNASRFRYQDEVSNAVLQNNALTTYINLIYFKRLYSITETN